MAIVFREWLNANENRAYPLHDSAKLISTSGKQLPHNLLVDANIVMPSLLGTCLYVSSVGVSNSLVTVTFFASTYNPICGAGAPAFLPAAVITLTKPVIKYKNYPVTPLYPGVAGWVSFGSGVDSDETLSLLFGDPSDTLLLDRAVKVYNELPVTSIGKLFSNTMLTGVIQLKGVQGVTKTAKAMRTIDGDSVPVITIGLDVALNKVSTLQDFAGTCGHRPQVGTCNKPAITSINSVTPDSHGNINIEFIGDEVITDTHDGLVIDYPLGIDDTCPPKNFESIIDVPNDCENSSTNVIPSSSSSTPIESSSFGPESSFSSTSSGYYSENFSDNASEFTVVKGVMTIQNVLTDADTTDKRMVNAGGTLGDEAYAIDFTRLTTISHTSDSFTLSAIIHPRSSSEGHLIFGYKSNTNFFFAGMALLGATNPSPGFPTGRFFIGKRSAISGPSWADDLGNGYNFLAGSLYTPPVPLDAVDYNISVVVTNIGGGIANIALAITWIDAGGTSRMASHSTNTPFNMLGYLGFGCVDAGGDSVTEFDNVVLDTPTMRP